MKNNDPLVPPQNQLYRKASNQTGAKGYNVPNEGEDIASGARDSRSAARRGTHVDSENKGIEGHNLSYIQKQSDCDISQLSINMRDVTG